jgi:hypothetical protein
VGISLIVQAAFVLTNVWLARQAGVDAGLAAWFVAWPLSKLIAVLPISLGGLGVREAALVSLLTPYGADGTAVLASGLLWQAVLAVSGLVGLAVTQMLRRRVAASPSSSPGGACVDAAGPTARAAIAPARNRAGGSERLEGRPASASQRFRDDPMGDRSSRERTEDQVSSGPRLEVQSRQHACRPGGRTP